MNVSFLSMELPTTLDVSDIFGVLGVLVGLCLLLGITLLIARFRSFFASIFALPALSQLVVFLIANVEAVKNLFTSGNQFMNGVLIGISAVNAPVSKLHECNVALLCSIIPVEFIQNIIKSDIFAFVFYLVLFFLFFLIFHKRKRGSKDDRDDF